MPFGREHARGSRLDMNPFTGLDIIINECIVGEDTIAIEDQVKKNHGHNGSYQYYVDTIRFRRS